MTVGALPGRDHRKRLLPDLLHKDILLLDCSMKTAYNWLTGREREPGTVKTWIIAPVSGRMFEGRPLPTGKKVIIFNR